jgi:hypothetical protein
LGHFVKYGLKPLNYIKKILVHGTKVASVLGPALTGITLSGCISSTAPVLTDAKPVLGERGQIRAFTLSGGAARDAELMTFRWSGSRYLLQGKSQDISDFTVHPYQGRDLIVQSTAARAPRPVEYALARRLADGTYLIVPIDEDDADEPTRAKFCTKTQDASCRIATPEQLFVFARITADKPIEGGGLAVIVPDGNGATRR